MDIIERAARALCEGFDPDEVMPTTGEPLWRDYVATARAVLQAIREPDEGMLIEGSRWTDDADTNAAKDFWQAMIDQALKD